MGLSSCASDLAQHTLGSSLLLVEESVSDF